MKNMIIFNVILVKKDGIDNLILTWRKKMRKLLCFIIALMLVVSISYAYNPNSFYDIEEISVIGERPRVDIEASELVVYIDAKEFSNGVAEKKVEITNAGSVVCDIVLTLKDVPVDLNVTAEVLSSRLRRGERTALIIRVELTEQQEIEDFQFTILVEAFMS